MSDVCQMKTEWKVYIELIDHSAAKKVGTLCRVRQYLLWYILGTVSYDCIFIITIGSKKENYSLLT